MRLTFDEVNGGPYYIRTINRGFTIDLKENYPHYQALKQNDKPKIFFIINFQSAHTHQALQCN